MVPEKKLRVLLVEDNPGDAELVRVYLKEPRDSIELSCVPSLGAARAAMDPGEVDLVLLDLGLPDGDGMEVVGKMRQIASHVPIVVLTGRDASDWGVEALKRDAQDYLIKDQIDAPSLRRSIHHAIERHRSQEHFRHQLSVSPDGVIITDVGGQVRFVNAAAEELLGAAPTRVEDLPEGLRLQTDGAPEVVLDSGRIVSTRSVETAWLRQPACMITLHDITERRRAENALSALTDELRRTNERLEQLVGTDPLTEVLNRRGIEEALSQELGRLRRTQGELVAILVDFDDFKAVNDSYGHAVGDAALRALTRGVREALRATDHLGRVGGDEFLILLPGAGVREGLAVAEKLRLNIKSTTLPVADGSVSLSASLAVGVVDAGVVSLEQVLESVNLGLRRSKERGKDRVSVPAASEGWASGAGTATTTSVDVAATELQTALQAIHDIDAGQVVGFEALTRGPAGPFARPADLFRAAFEMNVLTTVDLSALVANLGVLRNGEAAGWYHVNLFPSTILNTPVDRIIRLLSEAAQKHRLCVELSEQQFLGEPAYLSEPLATLRENGIRVAVDDVGFGRSSIEALLVLEPDIVKIDQSCIRSIHTQPEARRRLEQLIAMIAVIQAEVIVEGVESTGELEALREMGVRYAQGFFWGQPELAVGGQLDDSPRPPEVR